MAEPTQHSFPSDEGTPEEEFLYLVGEASDLLQAGRLDAAKRELERALKLRPEHEQAKNLLGLTLFRLGDLDPAQQIFEELVHDNPVEPSLRLNLAMVHLKASRLQEAREELERALDLNPEHRRAASYMAMVCERLGQREDAAEWYDRAGQGEQAAALRAAAKPTGGEDEVPAPPPVTSAEGAAHDELMPDPLAGALAVADGEVQAAALSALRAEALSRPSAPPSTEDAHTARAASQEFTLDMDDAPAPPPLEGASAEDEGGYIDPFAEDEPSEQPAALPIQISADEVELKELEPAVERTLPYAAVPSPPPGRAPLRDVVHEAVASPPPDDSVPDGAAAQSAELSSASVIASRDDDKDAETMPAPAEVRAAPPGPTSSTASAPPAAEPRKSAPQSAATTAPSTPSSPVQARGGEPAALTLDGLGARGAASEAKTPFVDEDGLLVFPIQEAAYLRTDLLVGLRGSFEVEPVYRRYRGRRTDSFFGGSKTPLAAVLGDGRAWLDADGAEVTVLALKDEELYLVEGTMLAFSAGLVWENGRLPEAGGKDLDIVHLRGTGRVVLQTERALRAIESGDKPVTVAAPRLVGWAGSLVPSRGLFPGLPDTVERPSIVRFEGSGRILVV